MTTFDGDASSGEAVDVQEAGIDEFAAGGGHVEIGRAHV